MAAIDPLGTLDPLLREFIVISEVDEGWRFADALFQRKYAHPAPRYPHHLALFYRDEHARYALAHFLHFFPVRDMALIGGACTDGDVVRRMSEAQRVALEASG